MKTFGVNILLLIVIISNSSAEETADAKAMAMKLASEMATATVSGDYTTVIDRSLPKVIELMGGREKAIEFTRKTMNGMKEDGQILKSFIPGEPSDLFKEGPNTFVIIPTTMKMTFADGEIISKSYLLGVSADGGKTWLFADGTGMKNTKLRDRVLPKLPMNLKLPEPIEPEIIKK